MSSRSTCRTYRRRIGDRYASTTVVSPRETSFISGHTSCETETCAKPSSRARRRQRELVLREAVAVHQDDRDGGDARIARAAASSRRTDARSSGRTISPRAPIRSSASITRS